MCGIAGFVHADPERLADAQRLRRMTDVVSYRGPDGEGFHVQGNLALGHRRLSIIDLDTGDQPMSSDDGTVTISYNGEIYNYLELREELRSLGHVFRTGIGHRGDHPRLPGLGPGLPATAQRHVGLRALGPDAPPPAAVARPPRREAAALRRDGRHAALRVRDQEPVRLGPGAAPGSALDRGLRLPELPAGASHVLPGRLQAAGRPAAWSGRTAPTRSAPTGTCRRSTSDDLRTDARRRGAGIRRAVHRRGADPHAQRRAVRRLPERRPRLELHRGRDGGHQQPTP